MPAIRICFGRRRRRPPGSSAARRERAVAGCPAGARSCAARVPRHASTATSSEKKNRSGPALAEDLCIGSSSTVTPMCRRSSTRRKEPWIVAVRRRRASCRRRRRPAVGSQDDLVAALVRDPGELHLALARRIFERTRPCRSMSLCGVVARAGEQSRHLRVLNRDLLALLVGQRLDVQDERLLDLGAVEESLTLLRRDLGWSGSMERRREDRVRRTGVASTGRC